ncbi:MAG: hypothetical protein BGO68_05615 [Candidatus Amoebophilus sp. 36-38]|nr:MAG: hypothetical protein BGO68_05615 [Candidatus Amoebophilus sp. 36-38]
MMLAEIITIGNELLYGRIANQNAQYISTQLTQAGFRVIQITTIPDEIGEIIEALSGAKKRGVEVVITTGGLGPTSDDLTRAAFLKYFNYPSTASNLAWSAIENHLGTAPGICCKQDNQVTIALPGVPAEMQSMLQQRVLPYLKSQFNLPTFYQKTICTIGIVEEELARILTPWEKQLPSHIQLAYLPNLGTVNLTLTTRLTTAEEAKKEIELQVQKVLPLIKDYVYGYEDDKLEEVVGNLLQSQHKSLAIAESCSGGYASQLIVQVPGCSAYYYGGIVAYNNRIKQEVLGVSERTLLQYGAVSQQTAMEMAQQVRIKFKASIGLSSTGIAGPGKAVNEINPVGAVWIGYADEDRCYAKKLQLTTNRLSNIRLTGYNLLDLLRRRLQGIYD